MSSTPQLEMQPSPQKKALFIDADPEVRAMLENILDPLVWSIRHAPDNKTALTLAEAIHFDLILTSEKTSGKEDVELVRRIRRMRPHTRLIILAEESTPVDVIASMRESAFSYFSRPFSPASLADMVLTAAEGPCWDDGIEILSATPDWIRHEIEHAAIANPYDDPTRHVAYRDAKGMRPGGYGILLAQKLVDELIYSEKGNEVLLLKYVDVTPFEAL
jgi:CheY-like chemotaxis protein